MFLAALVLYQRFDSTIKKITFGSASSVNCATRWLLENDEIGYKTVELPIQLFSKILMFFSAISDDSSI